MSLPCQPRDETLKVHWAGCALIESRARHCIPVPLQSPSSTERTALFEQWCCAARISYLERSYLAKLMALTVTLFALAAGYEVRSRVGCRMFQTRLQISDLRIYPEIIHAILDLVND